MKKIKSLLVYLFIFGLAACGSNHAPVSNGIPGNHITINNNLMVNSVFFDSNSHLVNKSYHKLLTINANYLISHPYSTIQIQGNSVEVGTLEHNQELALIRAQSVKQALISLGVPAKQISVVSYGNSKQLFPTESGVRQSKNQRADISYSSLPPYQYRVEKFPIIDTTTMY